MKAVIKFLPLAVIFLGFSLARLSSFGQSISRVPIDTIANSYFDYEFRLSYEGIIGTQIIIQQNNLQEANAYLIKYAYKSPFNRKKVNNYTYYSMKFDLSDYSLEKFLLKNFTELPNPLSMDCYRMGFDGNTLTVELKIGTEIRKYSYWEVNTHNRDCLSKYPMESMYLRMMFIEKLLNADSIFFSKLPIGEYGNFGGSVIIKNH